MRILNLMIVYLIMSATLVYAQDSPTFEISDHNSVGILGFMGLVVIAKLLKKRRTQD